MRITVNLASRPFADLGPALKKLRLAMLATGIVALLLGGGLYALHTRANAVRVREHSLDASIAQTRQEQQGYEAMMQQPANAQVLSQSEFLNRIFDEKAFSWTLTMEDLETVLPGGVQVTTLEPIRDKKDGHITLRMRVVGPRDKAVELVQNLEHSRHFLQPRIIGESAEAQGNGSNQQLEPVSASNRVNFELLADYNPPSEAERDSADKKIQAVTPTAAKGHSTRTTHKPAAVPRTAPPPKPNPARKGVPR